MKLKDKYYTYIDGIRAIAVIAVLFYHISPEIVQGGFIGVDLFFVISGYLISKIIFDKLENGKFSFLNFFASRVKRIFPALFFTIFLTSAAYIVFIPTFYFEDFSESVLWSSLQLSNFYFAKTSGYFSDEGIEPLLHTWSLGVEAQFYILWPILMYLCFKIKNPSQKRVLAVIGSVSLYSFISCQYWLDNNLNKAFFMFYTRIWEFGLGAIMALNIFPKIRNDKLNEVISILCLVIVFLSVFFIENNTSFLKGIVLIPCIALSFLIFVNSYKATFASRILSLGFLKFIGLSSSSIYLWHLPVITFYKYFFGFSSSFFDILTISLITLICSVPCYLFIEKPLRKINLNPIKVIIAGILVMIITALLSISLFNKLEANKHSFLLIEKTQIKEEKSLKSFFHIPDKYENYKIFSSKYSDQEGLDILAIGDSHISNFYPMLNKYAYENKLNIMVISKPSCPPLIGDYKVISKRSKNAGSSEEDCNEHASLIKKYIPKAKKIFMAMRQDLYTENDRGANSILNLVFLSNSQNEKASRGNSRKVFKKQLTETIEFIAKYNNQLYFIGQAPIYEKNLRDCTNMSYLESYIYKDVKHKMQKTKCLEFNKEYVAKRLKYSTDLIQDLADEFSFKYIDSVDAITSAVAKSDFLIYKDNNHLNIIASKHLNDFLQFYISK